MPVPRIKSINASRWIADINGTWKAAGDLDRQSGAGRFHDALGIAEVRVPLGRSPGTWVALALLVYEQTCRDHDGFRVRWLLVVIMRTFTHWRSPWVQGYVREPVSSCYGAPVLPCRNVWDVCR
jgi:hypothetical protein